MLHFARSTRALVLAIVVLASTVPAAAQAQEGPGEVMPIPDTPYHCWSENPGEVNCLDESGPEDAFYTCTIAGNYEYAFCRPDPYEAGPATADRARSLETALVFTAMTNPSRVPAMATASSSARSPVFSTSPRSQGSGRHDACQPVLTAAVERDPAETRTLRVDWGDGSSQDYSVSAGSDTETLYPTHAYWTEDFDWLSIDPAAHLGHELHYVTAKIVETGQVRASFIRHEVVVW